MADFTKLSNLIDSTFTIVSVSARFTWKKWDAAANQMLTSETFIKGYRKVYQVETDAGTLDLGAGQIGNLLEAAMNSGKSDLIGKTFELKSNGKSGIDIRYFFNLQREERAQETTDEYSDYGF